MARNERRYLSSFEVREGFAFFQALQMLFASISMEFLCRIAALRPDLHEYPKPMAGNGMDYISSILELENSLR